MPDSKDAEQIGNGGRPEGAKEVSEGKSASVVPSWLALISGLLTVSLSLANAYWAHQIQEVDDRVKEREASIKQHQVELEADKGRLERYAFAEKLLDGALSQNEGQKTITVNLIRLALGNTEADQLFAGLKGSEDHGIKTVGTLGTEAVNRQYKVFLHFKKNVAAGSSSLKPATDALSEAGFQIMGNDGQADRYGRGVDYFFDQDYNSAVKVCGILNGTIAPTEKQFEPRLQKVKNALGTIGVWY